MKLQWFQHPDDGTYFRNMSINLADRRREMERLYWPHARRARRNLLFLEAEFKQIATEGLVHSPTLPEGRTVVGMKPFRESHPNHPALWTLDNDRTAGA